MKPHNRRLNWFYSHRQRYCFKKNIFLVVVWESMFQCGRCCVSSNYTLFEAKKKSIRHHKSHFWGEGWAIGHNSGSSPNTNWGWDDVMTYCYFEYNFEKQDCFVHYSVMIYCLYLSGLLDGQLVNILKITYLEMSIPYPRKSISGNH